MVLHAAYPQYGFDSHVGYGTPQHLAALAALARLRTIAARSRPCARRWHSGPCLPR